MRRTVRQSDHLARATLLHPKRLERPVRIAVPRITEPPAHISKTVPPTVQSGPLAGTRTCQGSLYAIMVADQRGLRLWDIEGLPQTESRTRWRTQLFPITVFQKALEMVALRLGNSDRTAKNS